ncbi:MAG: RNA-guided endonuclease TnpB family protein [Moorellaceae bacterium]
MKLVKTIRCKLQVDNKQVAILLETLQRFANACNDILPISQENHTINKVKLQHLCYRVIKEKYGLQANLVIRAIARVAEAAKKKRKPSKPRKFKPTSMSLDQRTFSFNEKRWEVSGKERRWMADLNHRIAKAIIDSCDPGDVILMEDLRYIRERIRAAKEQRLLQHSWAFGQLGKFIEYKAAERGIDVVYVDPRHTSQRCPRCGSTNRSNRHGHLFRCTSCGFAGHADIVAATNIRQVYLETLADGLPSVGPQAASSCKPLALAMG